MEDYNPSITFGLVMLLLCLSCWISRGLYMCYNLRVNRKESCLNALGRLLMNWRFTSIVEECIAALVYKLDREITIN